MSDPITKAIVTTVVSGVSYSIQSMVKTMAQAMVNFGPGYPFPPINGIGLQPPPAQAFAPQQMNNPYYMVDDPQFTKKLLDDQEFMKKMEELILDRLNVYVK